MTSWGRTEKSHVVFELQTRLDLRAESSADFRAFVDALRESVPAVASAHPAVRQFFVEADKSKSEMLVGLRVRKSGDNGVEEIADTVLIQALHRAQGLKGGARVQIAVRQTETTLA